MVTSLTKEYFAQKFGSQIVNKKEAKMQERESTFST